MCHQRWQFLLLHSNFQRTFPPISPPYWEHNMPLHGKTDQGAEPSEHWLCQGNCIMDEALSAGTATWCSSTLSRAVLAQAQRKRAGEHGCSGRGSQKWKVCVRETTLANSSQPHADHPTAAFPFCMPVFRPTPSVPMVNSLIPFFCLSASFPMNFLSWFSALLRQKSVLSSRRGFLSILLYHV